ncbi:alpha/beta-hydrolase [Melanomma pulvis-pyrius CBS 109.77]|uniref:Alpha/beta-hydrolase n=1 Tax=Melanomma pulvis-pyrius CBS 109.77 TaxID=1314802 RepID=A0A6A6WRC6_9PLEO|nr:alpha/beta-hydrolase [Melanomma pulvis-pyrius CBS 109.77]
MSCPQCFTGHVNPGTPTGRWETVYGLRTYIAEPAGGKETLGIIVIVPDAFGVDFVNNQILADHYASAAQFLVYLPDFMNGNAAPVRTMINMAHMWDENESWFLKPYYIVATMMDFLPFLFRNRLSVSWPRVTKFLQELREDKGAAVPVGIAGFCWGGLHAIKLSHDTADTKTESGRPLAEAFFAAHPSNVNVPEDVGAVKHNLSVAIGDDDGVMGIKQVREAEAILKTKADVDSEVVVYPGAKHGFSIRASRAVPDSKETQQAEEVEKQAIAWFQRQFAAAGPK